MEKVIVIGAGTMGNGIAHVFALGNYEVLLFDQSSDALDKARLAINNNLERQLKKEIITKFQLDQTISNIQFSSSIKKLPLDSNLVIEAIVENKTAKTSLYNDLKPYLNETTILATNTSSISITELAPVGLTDRFIGMHFMNPVPVMALVEVIPGYDTSNQTINKVESIIQSIGKTAIVVKDYPGFISNRILMPMINEAIFALYEGVASAEDIDAIMKLGMNHPMGPLMLADFIGLDVCLNIMEVLNQGFADPKYRACPLLKKMVAAGKLGKKSGIGFYKYRT